MKEIKMSLISRTGRIVNEWTVPYARRHDALDHALDRAEQEGHAGVLWAVVNDGAIREMVFDSLDPHAVLRIAEGVQPFTTVCGLDVDRLIGSGRVEALSQVQRSGNRV